jgi:hypothetical protein
MDDYKNSKYERKEHGAFIVDGVQVGTTLQCPHCGGHFLSVRGSGARRGFCMNCMAVTCGHPSCDACIPIEKKLGILEK